MNRTIQWLRFKNITIRIIKIKDGIPSDHRVLWVELSLIDVFGANDIITKKVTKLTFKFSKGKSLQS